LREMNMNNGYVAKPGSIIEFLLKIETFLAR
jgi:hypothetical protein